MLTFEEAKIIGRNACIEKLGRDFFEKHRENSTSAYGDFSDEGITFCYIGVDDNPSPKVFSGSLILSGRAKESAIPFSVSCNVNLADGKVEYLDFYLP